MPDEAVEARNQFLAYNHLLFREWRTRVCPYLTQHSFDPFDKAFYLNEVSLCGVRQNIRSHYPRDGESYVHSSVEDFKKDVRHLPEDLTVVQFHIDHNKILWFSRLHAKLDPFTIPLTDLANCTIQDRLSSALEENLATTHSSRYGGDSKRFWTARMNVDKKLAKILADIEAEWLTPILPLLLPYTSKMPATLATQLSKSGLTKDAAKMLINAAVFVENKKNWLFLVKIVCCTQNLPYESVEGVASACYDKITDAHVIATNTSIEDKFTILNLCPELSCVSLENISFLKDFPLVSRVPSFKLFCNLINKVESVPKPFNGRKSYFLLNPGNDLPDTEKRIGEALDKYNFDGIKNIIPEHAQIAAVLNKYDVYLYIGHGGGGRYYSRNVIRSSKCNAISILMGCDSVAITIDGTGFDGRSSVYDYIIARCPCLVGCLYMVTDGDIDRFFIALLEYCFSHLQVKSLEAMNKKLTTKKGYITLLQGIAQARERCRLKYLQEVQLSHMESSGLTDCLVQLKKEADSISCAGIGNVVNRVF
ncbi:hypothetical protein L596_006136 [Steinernema carpocapsae]|uniref:separase n=1 Tax=Steinernema carpocapsae TaxID=34508 RepID=A0A4U8V2J6_STECR|nr:hypothetical protein L596_006136 [Steinernema carpocapsae]